MHKINSLLSRFNMRQFISRLSDGRSASTKKVTTMSYTTQQVETIQRAAQELGTLNGQIAAELANEIGMSKRSVIAKIKSLGLDYAVAAKPVKGTRATSKAEYVAAIAAALDADAAGLAGLEKSTASALSSLLAAIR